jgi:hypothetical protein
MDKEFVTYKQAVALQELGFNEECLSFFDDNGKYLFQFGYNQTEDDVRSCIPNYVKAPLKQQVFRWFQNKYNWYHIMDFCRKAYPSTNQYKWKIDIGLGDVFFMGWADTYEEAENACIDKLIEIAKQQDK